MEARSCGLATRLGGSWEDFVPKEEEAEGGWRKGWEPRGKYGGAGSPEEWRPGRFEISRKKLKISFLADSDFRSFSLEFYLGGRGGGAG